MPTNTVGFLNFIGQGGRERESDVAKKQVKHDATEDQSLTKAFFSGFLWPVRFIGMGLKYIWKAIVWLSHKPPLKQLGHSFRWFFRLKGIRLIGRVLGFGYIRESFRELKQVTWPTFHESMRLTGAVMIFSVIFGILIAIVDFGLDKLFREVLLK